MQSRIKFRAVATMVGALALTGVFSGQAAAAGCPNEAIRVGQGDAVALPECRAYELVSPVEKGEHDAVPMGAEELWPVQATEGGAALGFAMPSPLAGPTKGGPLVVPYVSERGPNGWEAHSLASPMPQRPPSGAYISQYFFSRDLSRLTFTTPLQQLTPGAPADVINLYNLDRAGDSYSLISSAPPSEPVPPGCAECFAERDVPVYEGSSSDGSQSIFGANEALVPGAPSSPYSVSLYENVGGQVRLAGVLPDGSIPPGGSIAGAAGQALLSSEPYFFYPAILANPLLTPIYSGQIENAISEDGSRILFSATADGAGADPGQEGSVQLFDRVRGNSEGVTGSEGDSTLQISKPAADAPAEAPAGPARFWAATPDGSRVLFASRQNLTGDANAGAGGGDLYLATVTTAGGETTRTGLTDLTADPAGAGAQVLGVVGTSRDLGYVYFAAQGTFPGVGPNAAGEAAIEGEPNLYLAHGGAITFIATLAPKPPEEPAVPNEPLLAPAGESGRLRPGDEYDWAVQPARSQAYVTPDGRHLAFMSLNSLTGASDLGQLSGRRVSEVFEFSADDGSLVCASCKPEGGRPIGNSYLGARNNVTGNYNEQNQATVGMPFHHPRFMNASGSEVYFSATDPGLLEEASGEGIADTHARVYEYANGHVSLLSARASSLNEEFLDASESGEDVFISSRARLAPEDNDSNGDIYDVKVDGGFAFHAVSACEGEAGCRSGVPGGTPGTPAIKSEVNGRTGNLPAAAPGKKKHARNSSGHRRRDAARRRKLKRALARCDRLSRGKRATCKQAARKRFGAKGRRRKRGSTRPNDNRRTH